MCLWLGCVPPPFSTAWDKKIAKRYNVLLSFLTFITSSSPSIFPNDDLQKMRGQNGYTAIPTTTTTTTTTTDPVEIFSATATTGGDGDAGPSRSASTTSSLSSSPLQHTISTFYNHHDDNPSTEFELELSEKKSKWDSNYHSLPTHIRRNQTTRSKGYGGILGNVLQIVHRGKTILLLTICLVLVMIILLQDHTPTTTTTTTMPTKAVKAEGGGGKGYQLEDDIVLITKVGTSTVHSRLPIHLSSRLLSPSLYYTPNQLYVSDYPLVLPSYNITLFDALSNVSSTISSLSEFSSLKSELSALIESNQDLSHMSSKDGGWKLDKYKFLPMMAEAWRRFPSKKWYIVIEADTFLFYHELIKFLSTLDSEEQYILGHPSFCDYDGKSTMFTHGGSGIVLSGKIMELSFGKDEEFEHNHDDLIQDSAFGDALLSKALYDTPGIKLKELSPEGRNRFNSDPPRILKFHRGNWCDEILSFHHITGTDAEKLYDFERRITPLLSKDDTIRWGDIWDEFTPSFLKKGMKQVADWDQDKLIKPGSTEPGEIGVIGWQTIEDWDSETIDKFTKNAQKCQDLCRSNSECIMWQWRQMERKEGDQIWSGDRKRNAEKKEEGWGKCRYTTDFLRIGLTKPNQKDGLTTGWMSNRIDKWRQSLECSGRTGLNSY